MINIALLAIVAVLALAGYQSMSRSISYYEALVGVIKWPFTFFKNTPKP